jgi:hypothetical protein
VEGAHAGLDRRQKLTLAWPELKVEELRVVAGFEQPGSRKSHRGLAFVA